VLEAHDNEVWFLQFSHNGCYLASASKDLTAILWEVVDDGLVKLKHTLTGHQKPVSFVAWSPDDSMLLTCGNEESVKLWDTSTGECKHTFSKPNSCFTSCAWFPDGNRFVSGGGDKSIYMWNLEVQSFGVIVFDDFSHCIRRWSCCKKAMSQFNQVLQYWWFFLELVSLYLLLSGAGVGIMERCPNAPHQRSCYHS
jgi:WD40 repeat protein